MSGRHSQDINCNELWREVRKGSRKAFEMLYNELIIPLSEYAFRLLKDDHAVKDILQDLFVNIYIRREEIGEHVNIAAYMHQAVKYKVVYVLRDRANKKIQSLSPDEVDEFSHIISDDSEERDMHVELANNMKILPVKCRKAFILNYVDELPYKSIASEMNISIKTVEKHISKALRILRSSRWTNQEM